MKDIELNSTFALVAADLSFVPGGHYSLAECQAHAANVRRPRRNSKGQFVAKKVASA